MQNDDGTTHPATVQADILERITPATVVVWLRRKGLEAYHRNDMPAAQALGLAANVAEGLIKS